MKSFTQSCEV